MHLRKVNSLNNMDLEITEAFATWTNEHKRLYSSPEENDARFANFAENYLMIKKSNAANKGYTLGLNETADMSEEEFRAEYGLTAPDMTTTETTNLVEEPLDFDIKQGQYYTVNWQTAKKANLARNFGLCNGAGNLFSAIAAYESIEAIKYQRDVTVSSPQLVMNCMPKTKGCQGDSVTTYLSYLYSKGCVPESTLSWKASLGECPSGVTPTNSLVDYTRITNYN